MFVGWFIYCEFIADYIKGLDTTFLDSNALHPFETREHQDILITTMYYGFTTLSTVGFGDLTPLNSPERFVCAFIMLFGVAITSLVLSWFLDLIATFKTFDQDLSEAHEIELDCFFDCITKRFNKE